MNIYDAMFLIGFFGCLGIVAVKIYNLLSLYNFSKGKEEKEPFYGFPGAVMTFIGYFIAWVISVIVVMLEPEQLLYSSLLYLLNWLISINVLMFICEVFLLLKDSAQTGIKAHKAVQPNLSKIGGR